MEGASVRGADRAPLIDLDAEEEAGADPNRLSWLDCAWLVLHLAGASGDALALRALLSRRFKGALFFGGHTQFLGNWSLCLSIGTRGHYCPAPRAPHTTQRPRPAPAPFCTFCLLTCQARRASLRRVCASMSVRGICSQPWPGSILSAGHLASAKGVQLPPARAPGPHLPLAGPGLWHAGDCVGGGDGVAEPAAARGRRPIPADPLDPRSVARLWRCRLCMSRCVVRMNYAADAWV